MSFAMGDKAKADQDYRFEAVRNLHIRSVLTAREILCLMRGGYADGALGRWRTLHEISVVGGFLSDQDKSISEKYLLSRHCQAYKAAKQYKQHEIGANLEPFDENVIEGMKKRRDQIMKEYGDEMSKEWGWAASVINKTRVTFADVEAYIGLDHWRPRYKWACQDIHANHRPQNVMLGASESQEEVIIAMASNSGMTDPAQMTAHSITHIAAAFLMLEPNIDRTAGMIAMQKLQDEIGETFLRIEKETLERARSKRRWF